MTKLFKYLKPYWKLIIIAFAFVITKSYLNLLVPDLLGEVVALIPKQGSPPVADMIEAGLIAMIAVIGVIVAEIITGYLASKIAMAFGRDLRQSIFNKVTKLSISDFDSVGSSSLITRSINDVNQIQQVIMMFIRMMASAPIILVGGSILAYQTDPELTLIILASLPVIIIIFSFIILKVVPLYKKLQVKVDNLTLKSKENITGVRVIRAFGNDEYEKTKFDKANRSLTDVTTKSNRIMAFAMPMIDLIFSLVTVLIIWVAANSASFATLTTDYSNLYTVIQYSARIMMSFIMFVMMFVLIPRAMVSAKRINQVLDMPVSIKNPDKAKNPKKSKTGLLEFKNVSFYFTGAKEPAISKINFSAKSGQTVGIIGGTGSGKSTIINLLPRFYDVTSGKILIDGVDIKDYNLKDLRNKISIAPQKATLFNMSIADNIKFGTLNASQEEIKKAAEIAQAKNFIERSDKGYNHMVEKEGANLSGGQKQRLSIARAIIKNPEIYLFDDTFSALDVKTDSLLRKALKKETQNSTVIIVSQRINTIKDCDLILVLDNGKTVGKGTHKELLTTCEEYKEIYKSQTKSSKGGK